MASCREQMLEALFRRLEDLDPELGTVRRLAVYVLDETELEAITLIDGPETVIEEGRELGEAVIDTLVTVVVAVRHENWEGIGPVLNEAVARVKAVLLSDRTLGGMIELLDYLGGSEPDTPSIREGAPPHASMDLTFRLRRAEAEDDPYTWSHQQ